MTIGYRSNLEPLKIARQQEQTTQKISRISTQLSSGMRINTASEDPAGLGMMNTLDADSRIAARARLNIEDGISYVSTAQAAYQSTAEVLQRMNELANQSANGAIDSEQRNQLQKEFDALRSEIIRIQDASKFNDTQVAAGGATARSAVTLGSLTSLGSAELSSEARYLTFLSSSNQLIQRDLTTNSDTVIASGVSFFAVTPLGDQIGYTDNVGVYLYDRTSGASRLVADSSYASGIQDLAISDNGNTIAFRSSESFDTSGNLVTSGDSFLNSLDTVTGAVRGDGGLQEFVGASITDLVVSPDGSTIAIAGNDLFATGAWVRRTTNMASTIVDLGGVLNPTGNGEILLGADNALYLITSDDLGGANSSNKRNILRTTDGGTFSNLTNITNATNGVFNFYGSTDAGNSFVYITDSNISGENPSLSRQIVKTYLTGDTQQLTNTSNTTLINNTFAVARDGLTILATSGVNVQSLDLRPEQQLRIAVGPTVNGEVPVGLGSIDGAVRGLYDMQISTRTSALTAVDLLAGNIDRLALAQGVAGAGQARLETARAVATSMELEKALARDKIRDVDTAQAVSEKLKLELVSRSQTALMAQTSRLVPAIALDLLNAA